LPEPNPDEPGQRELGVADGVDVHVLDLQVDLP
jgi:hypothetical protein